ncbi:MAG: hypothetical protein ABIJ56_12305 [Pseudomonadota bacterium]
MRVKKTLAVMASACGGLLGLLTIIFLIVFVFVSPYRLARLRFLLANPEHILSISPLLLAAAILGAGLILFSAGFLTKEIYSHIHDGAEK